uniref:Uncharacterized protein n=1 Tax=Rousettus aegyptiacus TaxID=9407 RepID=A0A7J8F0C7_ROUAE|nr:hypothetical protein HJG63_012230 [Rousettus aegyptiacus]
MKVLPNPQILTKSGILLYSRGLDRLTRYQSQLLGQCASYPTKRPPKPSGGAEPLNFLWVHCPSSPSKTFRQSLPSVLHGQVFTCSHCVISFMGHFPGMGNENRGRSQATTPGSLWGCAGGIGETLERFIIVPPM